MFPGQQPYVGTVSTNSTWFNELSSDKQAMVLKAITIAEQAAHEYQIRINTENMDKIMAERPDMQLVILNEQERARFKEVSKSLHETYYNVVQNAYDDAEKAAARVRAEKILGNLIQEVKDAS